MEACGLLSREKGVYRFKDMFFYSFGRGGDGQFDLGAPSGRSRRHLAGGFTELFPLE